MIKNFMSECKFFNEDEKNELLNKIINVDYCDENITWDFALELEHISIMLRSRILEKE